MTANRKQSVHPSRVQRREPPSGGSSDSLGGSAGELLEQAHGWAEVAREAYEDCEKGRDAEAELHRRRNRSGQ